MTIKQRTLRLLEKAKLDSLALQIRDGTWLSNRNVRLYQGMKLPPANLMRRVAGTTDAHRFVWSGRLTATRILDLLQLEGLELSQVQSFLDFGCGCGRLTCYFLMLLGERKIYGSDTDAQNIQWCKANIPQGEFLTNDSSPRLPYSNGQFDLVISYSVFTHIKPTDQLDWFRELGRVVRAGGCFCFSTHAYDDIYQQHHPSKDERIRRYEKGEVVELEAKMGYVEQSNYGVFHPRGAVEQLAAATGCFEHRRTLRALKAPPMDSAGHNLHMWRRL